jgi:hypothetical protein
MRLFYTLDEKGVPQACNDLATWASWFETADRVVAQDDIGGSMVSTIFLGLDHSFDEGAQPILYETIVFGGKLDDEQERYSTREEAEAGHKRMVARLRKRYIDLNWKEK